MKHTLLLLVTALSIASCGGNGGNAGPDTRNPSTGAMSQSSAQTAGAYNDLLQRVFVAYFGRPADPSGLAYWAEQYRAAGAPATIAELGKEYGSNAQVRALVDVFGTSQESNDLYPGDNDAFVTAIYRNILSRAPDSAGKAYWVGLINSGAMTRPIAAIAIMAGAQSSDVTIIDNKAAVAAKFTAALNNAERIRGYDGLDANAVARAMLVKIDANTSLAGVNSTIEAAIVIIAMNKASQAPPSMAAGAFHTAVVQPDGSLWAWGQNNYGQLGDGSLTASAVPKAVGAGFTAIAAGARHMLALRADGSLWAWGDNTFGAVGDGSTTNAVAPKRIDAGFTAIAAGYFHSVALKADGSVWAWGSGDVGQIGDGGTGDVLVPKQVASGYVSIAAGGDFTLARKADGSLYAWGTNNYGQLGDGTTAASPVPKKIGTGYTAIVAGQYHAFGIKADGALWAWGSNDAAQLGDGLSADALLPKQVASGYGLPAAGGDYTLARKPDNGLWGWGANDVGQLGDGATVDASTPKSLGGAYSAVVAGYTHSVARKADGTIWTWGKNANNQLGDGSSANSATPRLVIAAPAQGTAAVVTSVDPLSATVGQPSTFNVRGSGLGAGQALAIADCPNPVALGGSVNVRSFRCTPASAGSKSATVTESSSGRVLFVFSIQVNSVATSSVVTSFAPGVASQNAVTTFTFYGTELSTGMSLSIDGCTGVSELAGGSATQRSFTCTPTVAGIMNGSIRAGNGGATLGTFTVTVSAAPAPQNCVPPQVLQAGSCVLPTGTPPGSPSTAPLTATPLFVAMAEHVGDPSFGISANGDLWGWGSSYSGTLGNGSLSSGYSANPILIGSGYASVSSGRGGGHTNAIKTDGTLWGWGPNSRGELGDGTTVHRAVPTKAGSGFKSVSSGYACSFGIKTDTTLWTWGSDCGFPARSLPIPTQIGTGFSSVSADGYGMAAIKTDGTLWLWGSNNHSRIRTTGYAAGAYKSGFEVPTQIGSNFKALVHTDKVTIGLKLDGSVWGWGQQYFGDLGNGVKNDGTYLSDPVQIGGGFSTLSAGHHYVAAMKPDGSIWMWGRISFQASETSLDSTRPQLFATGFAKVFAGTWTVYGIKPDGSLWFWGDYRNGGWGSQPYFSATPVRIN